MKKISPTRALTTTALLALAGLAAPVVAQSDAPAKPAAQTPQQTGPSGVPVAQQAPQMLRANRPLLKPAMIDLDELAKQPRLKPGMQRRLPGVKTPGGEPVPFFPGVPGASPVPAPAAEGTEPGIPGVVPVILPDQPRKRPEGWSVKPEEPATETVEPALQPVVIAPGVVPVNDAQPASVNPTIAEVAPNFAFPEVNTVQPAVVPAAATEVVAVAAPADAPSSTPTLGPSRLTAFGSSDVTAALPATGVSMPTNVVGTMPVPSDAPVAASMPQIEQSTTNSSMPVVNDSTFRSSMPVISDKKPEGSTLASIRLDENGQPLRPSVLPPEVREIGAAGETAVATTLTTPEPAPSLAATTAPVNPEPAPQPVEVVVSTPAPAEPVAVTPTEPVAPAPELTFRTPAAIETPAPASSPSSDQPVSVATVQTPAPAPAEAIPAPVVTTLPAPISTEPANISTPATAAAQPAAEPTVEPTFSNAVSAAAAKLAERAAAAAKPESSQPEATKPEPSTTTPEVNLANQLDPQVDPQLDPEIQAKLAAAREKAEMATTEAPAAPVSTAATSPTEPTATLPTTVPAPITTDTRATAVAADTGKPVEVLPAPTAGSAQDPFTAKGDGVAIRVSELTGTPGMVQWLRDGGGDWQIPELNEAGNGKYTIRTGPDAGAVVSINDATKLRVGRLSRAEVRAMSADAAGGQRRVVVALTRGRVAVIPAPGTAVNVYTPQSLVVVREPTEVIHDTASGTRTVAYVEKSPASAEVMTTP